MSSIGIIPEIAFAMDGSKMVYSKTALKILRYLGITLPIALSISFLILAILEKAIDVHYPWLSIALSSALPLTFAIVFASSTGLRTLKKKEKD